MIASRIRSEQRVGYRAIVFVMAVASALVLGFVFMSAPRASTEMASEDMVARFAPQPMRGDIVLLALDDAGVSRYGAIKEWPRSLIAGALSHVEHDGAKIVVMDLALDRRTHSGEDAALWRVIANNRNVVLGMAYNAGRAGPYTPDDIRSLVFLEKYAIVGGLTYAPTRITGFQYAQFEPPVSDFTGSSRGVGVFLRETDEDGVLRAARLAYLTTVTYPRATSVLAGRFPQSRLANGSPVALPSLALVAALRAFDVDKVSVVLKAGDYLALGGDLTPPVSVPVDDQARMGIRYAGPAGTYTRVSFADLVDGKTPPAVFKDKIVVVGATATNDPATDPTATPFGVMPRAEVTANAMATLLGRTYCGRFPSHWPAIMFVVGVVSGLGLMLVSGIRSIFAAILLCAAYLGVAVLLTCFGHVILPILPALLSIVLTLLMSLALCVGPCRPVDLEASPTYIPPPEAAVH